MRETIIDTVLNTKLIVIARGIAKEKLIPATEALYRGGIRMLEITYSASDPGSDEETAACIKMLVEHFEDRMLFGSGTTLTERQVELTKNAGGSFIISPDVNTGVIKKARELGLVSMPGALTPTEAQAAHLAGADFVKLFPISGLGADYLKAVKAPLSHIKFLAVGGINERNIPEYLKAGACGFGIGTNILDKKLIDNEDYQALEALAKKYTEAVNA